MMVSKSCHMCNTDRQIISLSTKIFACSMKYIVKKTTRIVIKYEVNRHGSERKGKKRAAASVWKSQTLRQHGKFMIGTNLLVLPITNMSIELEHARMRANVREKVCGFGCKVKATPVFMVGNRRAFVHMPEVWPAFIHARFDKAMSSSWYSLSLFLMQYILAYLKDIDIYTYSSAIDSVDKSCSHRHVPIKADSNSHDLTLPYYTIRWL